MSYKTHPKLDIRKFVKGIKPKPLAPTTSPDEIAKLAEEAFNVGTPTSLEVRTDYATPGIRKISVVFELEVEE